MPKPIASARAVMRLVKQLEIAVETLAMFDSCGQPNCKDCTESRADYRKDIDTLRAEIASRLRRMERRER